MIKQPLDNSAVSDYNIVSAKPHYVKGALIWITEKQ